MRVVVAMPINNVHEIKLTYQESWPSSWPTLGIGLLRQVNRFGNSAFSKSTVRTYILSGLETSKGRGPQLLSATSIIASSANQILVCIFELSTASQLDWIRRPNDQRAKALFLKLFGAITDGSKTVFATSVVATSLEIGSENGLLVVESGGSNFAFDVLHCSVVAAIGFERMQLEQATDRVFKPGFLGLGARRELRRLKSWLWLPASDSTVLLQNVSALRAELLLDERKNQVEKALQPIVRAFDLAVVAGVSCFGVSLTLVSTIQAQSLSDIFTSQGLLVSCVLSLLGAIVTWVNLRGK